MSTPNKKLNVIGATLAVALLLTACGGSSSSEQEQAGTTPSTSVDGGSGSGSGGGGVVTQDPTPTPSPAPGGTGSDTGSAVSYSFELTGSGGKKPNFTSPLIKTDSKLRVRITAGPAGNLSLPDKKYSNFTASYGCITYQVTVAGKTVTTKPLNPGTGGVSFCPQSESSQVLDFSDRMTPGHGKISVKVQNPKYDFYCQLWYYGWIYGSYSNFCPLYNVYKNHTVTGTVEVETNGTSL